MWTRNVLGVDMAWVARRMGVCVDWAVSCVGTGSSFRKFNMDDVREAQGCVAGVVPSLMWQACVVVCCGRAWLVEYEKLELLWGRQS